MPIWGKCLNRRKLLYLILPKFSQSWNNYWSFLVKIRCKFVTFIGLQSTAYLSDYGAAVYQPLDIDSQNSHNMIIRDCCIKYYLEKQISKNTNILHFMVLSYNLQYTK